MSLQQPFTHLCSYNFINYSYQLECNPIIDMFTVRNVHGTLNYLVSKQISVLWTLQVLSSVSWTLRKWCPSILVFVALKVSMVHFVIWCPTALEVYSIIGS